VGLGKDYTIFSLIDGVVKFEKYGPDRKKVKFIFLQLDDMCPITLENSN